MISVGLRVLEEAVGAGFGTRVRGKGRGNNKSLVRSSGRRK